ncbi:MAG: c-type cytochrome [Gemmatimonadetes bacterium]|nr:c-type cytochrome [Gemmatimonadota bacterium]
MPHVARSITRSAVALAALAAVTAFSFGGWATISVEDVPESLRVGQPTTFRFTIRQHGIEPLEGLNPSLAIRSADGKSVVAAAASPDGAKGRYASTFTIPRSGDWRVTINSGFGPSKLTLLPIAANATGVSLAAMTDTERGKHLFVAKGCVGCHIHRAVDERPPADMGAPELTSKAFDNGYLALWLANPRIRPATKGGPEMPNPQLSQKEIAPLVAFISSQGRATASK